MRVGIFDPYLDTLGGGEKYMLTSASCLSHDNDVYVFWDKDREILSKAEDRFGIDLSKVKLTKNIFSGKTSILSRIRTSREYDLIFLLSDGSIPIVFPKKLALHFQFPVEWVNGTNIIAKIKLAFVHKIICNSKFTKEFVDRTFGVNSVVLYPPADVNTKKDSYTEKKENVLLTVGRFGRLPEGDNFKKQDFMIDAFKQMVDGGISGWEFVLVISFKEEDAKYVERLEELTKGYPIKIFKNLNKGEISEIYNKAKIYWHAAGFGEDLKKHPERAEHFGISTVEAMGSGVIPVVINAGGQKEIVVDGKNGFLWNTKEELLGRTGELMKNVKMFKNMSSEAINSAMVFKKDRFCRELKEIIL